MHGSLIWYELDSGSKDNRTPLGSKVGMWDGEECSRKAVDLF